MRKQILHTGFIKSMIRTNACEKLKRHTVRKVTDHIWDVIDHRVYRHVTLQVWSWINATVWWRA